MKKLFLLLVGAILFASFSCAQNVGIGTATPASKLHIKGSVDITQLIIDANSTQSNTHPLIKLRKSDGTDLMWIHSDDASNTFVGLNAGRVNTVAGTGTNNTFTGSNAGYSNTTGFSSTVNGVQALYSNTTGHGNTAIGASTLYSNTTGIYNVANGEGALFYNTTGFSNTANGLDALYNNTSGNYNTANGQQALFSNTTGSSNTANGLYALYGNITGNYNTANGSYALSFNNESYNTASGYQALYYTSASQYNVALGYHAGFNFDNGYNNVFLGANTDVNGPGYYNDIAIGQGVICTDVSQARIGNSATGSIGGYADWSNISDGRYKKNVTENVKGLDFIMKLRPVTYNLDIFGLSQKLNESGGKSINTQMKTAMTEKEKMVQSGFIAQEVEQTAKSIGYDFSGVDKPKDDQSGFYGLRYAEFVVPLVKAVQEQQQIIETQKNDIETLKTQVAELTQTVNKLINK
jgi:hypothetical protein